MVPAFNTDYHSTTTTLRCLCERMWAGSQCLLSWWYRNAGESYPDHGEADSGPVRAVPPRGVEGRPGRGHQQEVVERDHQGSELTVVDHQCRVHSTYSVSMASLRSGTELVMCWVHHELGWVRVFFLNFCWVGWRLDCVIFLTSWNTLLSVNEYCSWIIAFIDSWLVECRVNKLIIG